MRRRWMRYQSFINIAFDTQLVFTLWMNGELFIIYLLSQDSMFSQKTTIKCDFIDAQNALKLHNCNVHNFYKPDIITEANINRINYYKMIFKLLRSTEYDIPNNLDFKFMEHCFGNHLYI